MWRNYLTVGIRALAKNRAYAAINIVGLAIGLAACVLILLYVRYEHELRRLDAGRRPTCSRCRPTTRRPTPAARRCSCR